jgi:amino acid adenylation domain-containing protein
MTKVRSSYIEAVVSSQRTKERDYWLEKLSGDLVKCTFPRDYEEKEAAARQDRFETLELDIRDELFTRVMQLSGQSDARLHMVTVAALAALLYKYTGHNDIIFGSPIRKQKASSRFVNTVLTLRNQILPEMTFKELLLQVRQTVVEATENVNYPMETLLYKLGFEDSQDEFPLFDIAVYVENVHDGAFIKPLRLNLIFSFLSKEDSIDVVLEYNASCYSRENITRIAHRFVHLLRQLVFNVNEPVSSLELVEEQEKQQLLFEFNETAADFPKNKTIHQLFEEQVLRSPAHTALIFENSRLTYAALDESAGQLAQVLGEKGVKPGVIVGLMLERSLEMIYSIIAVLKTGGAYLPLDPTHLPPERVSYLLKDSGLKLLLTRGKLPETCNLEEYGVENIDVKEIAGRLSKPGEQVKEPRTIVKATDLAYVIYTSGTTGKPKGVLVEHRGVVNMLTCRQQVYNMDESHVALQLFSYSFDGFITSFFTPVTAGSQTVLLSEVGIKDITAITRAILNNKVTHFICVPPLYHAIIESLSPLQAISLQTVILAGDKVSPALLEVTRQKNPHMEIAHEYGVTEVSVMSTFLRHQEKKEQISIGKPIWNTVMYILNEQGHVQPVGIAGELYIAGVGVARGYLNNPELTAEKFVLLNKSHKSYTTYLNEKKLYKTGDLARWLPEGNIQFLGRIDRQVKIRGFRLELEEIEKVLLNCKWVKDALVVTKEDKPGDKGLCCYYIVDKVEKQPELWPSVAEFFVYDDLLYYAMTTDESRNDSYKVAINRHVKDKVVLDIGTGMDVILSRFCVEAGAKKVYAIELLEETYKKARETIRELELEGKIHLIHGDATKVELPEKVDVCVSEIVGSIGGSEGAAVILNNARRFLKEGGVMIPEKSITKIAAAYLPDEIHENPGFFKTPGEYTEEIFASLGYRFDLRICINHLPGSCLISNHQYFEYLDFSAGCQPESSDKLNFVINKNARLDGFVVWMCLYTVEDEVIDILEKPYSWLPVFVPLFYPGVDVSAGDIIRAECIRTLSENNINPDFTIKGIVTRQKGENIEFFHQLKHFEKSYRSTPFYRSLFSEDSFNYLERIDMEPTAVDLKRHLAKTLPEYMLPNYFLQVDHFPLTPTGKIDIKALPEPEVHLNAEYEAPRDEIERTLVNIWSEVLGIETIGINDNLFEIGGDSIKTIQISARLQKYHLKVKLNDLFLNPTIKQLARCIEKDNRVIHQGPVSGKVEMTPALRWFFEKKFEEKHHLNQSLLRFNREGLDESLVREVFTKLVEHHDALRMVFIRDGDQVSPWNRGLGETSFDLETIDLTGETGIKTRIEKESNRIQRQIDLESGPLVKLGLFKTGQGDYLLIVIHHTLIDGVSWRILLEDFEAGYRMALMGMEISFPDKTDSFQYWARKLREHSSSSELLKELDYWKTIEGTSVKPLPADHNVPTAKNIVANDETQGLELNKEETRKLLEDVNWAYNTDINDILLTALVMTLNQWSGNRQFLINLEGHGRQYIGDDVNINRTIGWFTSQYPLLIDLEAKADNDVSDGAAPGDVRHYIELVKKSLREVPNKGLGYGILKYITPGEKKKDVTFDNQPEISFNYLGQFG